MLVIKNVTIVMPDHLIPDGVVVTKNGKITDFGRKLEIPPGAEVIDGGENYAGHNDSHFFKPHYLCGSVLSHHKVFYEK